MVQNFERLIYVSCNPRLELVDICRLNPCGEHEGSFDSGGDQTRFEAEVWFTALHVQPSQFLFVSVAGQWHVILTRYRATGPGTAEGSKQLASSMRTSGECAEPRNEKLLQFFVIVHG